MTAAHPSTPAPAVALTGLTAGYPGRPVLRDVTWQVQPGERVAVLGPNGAGKTTLLRVLTGLLKPQAGTVRLFGAALGGMPAADRARLLAVVPQELETPMAFTVSELVMIGRTTVLPRWAPPAATDRAAVEQALAATDVAHLADRLLTELSAGEKQRALVAMALAQEPRIMLMDEATAHLDFNHRLEIMALIERLHAAHGLTVVMTSHDLNLAAEFFPRLVLLDAGGIVADGPPEAVLTEPLLQRVYRCALRVQVNPANGSLGVVPAPRAAPGPTPTLC